MGSNIYRNRIQLAILILVLLDVFLVVYSCQSRARMNPVEGALTGDLPVPLDSVYSPPVYVTSIKEEDVDTGIGSMGVYYGEVNFQTMAGELTPLRESQKVGDPHLVDITGYLNGSPCGDCFKMESIALNNASEAEVTFSLRHPFLMPVNNPPQYRDRLDLNVFDVEAIFFFNESENKTTFNSLSGALLGPLGGAEILEADNSGFWASQNWDGFTNHFDSYVDEFWPTTANLHPYKMFFEDSSRGNVNADSQNGFDDLYHPTGHNVFPQGGGPDFQVVNFGSQEGRSISFVVLLSAAYGQSARFWGSNPGQRGNPRYFLPEFNRKEPWKIDVEIPTDTDLLGAGDPNSSTVLNIKVYDWQHAYGNVVGEYDPYTARLDSLSRSSRVNTIYAEIPGVSDLNTISGPESGTGFGDDPLIYKVTVNNALSAAEGEYPGLVAVRDDLHGNNLRGYGVERDSVTLLDMNQFAGYQMFKVSVIDRSGGSFQMGCNLYDPDGATGKSYMGRGILLDSMSGKSIAVYNDNVYVLGSVLDGPGGLGWDIYLFRSKDGGKTFELPQIINKDWQDGNVGDQVEPTLAVAPDTGYVYVAFTDRSKLRPGISWDMVYYRMSTDSGATFSTPAARMNPTALSSDQPTIGAGRNGVIWFAYRQFYYSTYPYIGLGVSSNYGETFYPVNMLYDPPINYEHPMILTNPSPAGSSEMMALLWKQAVADHGDIHCVVTKNMGTTFDPVQSISGEAYSEYAVSPRATMDPNGNIYCIYGTNNTSQTPKKTFISKGIYYTINGYVWTSKDISRNATSIFNDYDIVATSSGKIFAGWSQLDSTAADKLHDVFVFKSTDGITFSEFAHIQEPSELPAQQDMPRLTFDLHGKLYMVYRDTTFHDGGDIFLSIGSQ